MKPWIRTLLASLGASLCFCGPAYASSSPYTIVGDDPTAGNDCEGELGKPFKSCAFEGSPVIAKFDLESGVWKETLNPDVWGTAVTAAMFSFSTGSGGTTGTWSYAGSTVAISYFSLKAGNAFRVFKMDTPGVSFSDIFWSTELAELLGPKGQPLEISHITFFDTRVPAEIPIPAAAWLLGSGLLAMGAIGRRRMGARA